MWIWALDQILKKKRFSTNKCFAAGEEMYDKDCQLEDKEQQTISELTSKNRMTAQELVETITELTSKMEWMSRTCWFEGPT